METLSLPLVTKIRERRGLRGWEENLSSQVKDLKSLSGIARLALKSYEALVLSPNIPTPTAKNCRPQR